MRMVRTMTWTKLALPHWTCKVGCRHILRNRSTIPDLDASITLMPNLRWVVGLLLLGLAGYVCSCNIVMVYRSSFRGEHHSLGLVIGGLVAMAGVLVFSLVSVHRWFL